MIAVSDTSAVNYLILLDEIDLLQKLYGGVVLPPAVHRELLSPMSPEAVRKWVNDPPSWLRFADPSPVTVSLVDSGIDAGEREAIALAIDLEADLVLIDDAKGRREAAHLHLSQTGTLGVLLAASKHGWIDLPVTLQRLRVTSFFVSDKLLHRLLSEAGQIAK